jgi:hypothetical protein
MSDEEEIDNDPTEKLVLFQSLTVEDLNPKKYPITDGILKSNLLTLCQRLNQVQKLYGFQFVVTSGLRDQAQQQNLVKAGKSKALNSKHLIGCAVDIYDPDGDLRAFLLNHPDVLIAANLWCEDSESTPNWCHFQIVPPKSGNRWFKP